MVVAEEVLGHIPHIPWEDLRRTSEEAVVEVVRRGVPLEDSPLLPEVAGECALPEDFRPSTVAIACVAIPTFAHDWRRQSVCAEKRPNANRNKCEPADPIRTNRRWVR